MNNRPLDYRTTYDHLNTRLVRYSDPHCTGLVTAARAGVKTSLAVYLAEIAKPVKSNWSFFWAGHKKVNTVGIRNPDVSGFRMVDMSGFRMV